MAWQRRRRHNAGLFYWDTNRFRPTSWGVHEGPATYNVTRRRGSLRLPFGLGSWTFGKGTSRRTRHGGSGCFGYVLVTLAAGVTAAALFTYFYVIPTVTTWLHSVGITPGGRAS